MRRLLSAAGIASILALGSCGSWNHGRADASGVGPPTNPVRLTSEPACGYQVVGRISGRYGSGVQIGNSAARQARSLGASAVIDYTETKEYDTLGRPIATNWEALAIRFSNPSDSNCYR